MDTFHISLNPLIIESLFKTHLNEAKEFINLKMILIILAQSLLPLLLLFYTKPQRPQKPILIKFTLIGVYIFLFAGIYTLNGKNIVFTFKAYKPTIDMLNPIAPIRSSIRYLSEYIHTPKSYTPVGEDAILAPNSNPKIFVLIIGESARAKNFEYNGYQRPTNPYTKNLKNLVNFKNFYSCGVITAISIPCMLTNLTHKTYTSRNLSLYRDNILDIAQRAGYSVWWISNNGGECMGEVCKRITHISYYNHHLDGQMLPEITELIQKSQTNTFIVINLHGSHGTKYFERYPKDFTFFKPVCTIEELQECKQTELINAYDNSLRYTDFFISEVIQSLQKSHLNTALWYLSDHGESLGENSQYMHGGLPYSLAPEVQKHIPSMIWLGKGFVKPYWKNLSSKTNGNFNQDYLFHTLLHFLDIQTKDYDKNLDLLCNQ